MSSAGIVVLLGTLSLAHAALGVTLARDGQALCPIVVADDAIGAERTAAEDLASILGQVTGATFAVVGPADIAEDAPQILVGQSERASTLALDIDFATLASDATVVRTVGDVLILSGGRPRGAVYAVTTFLEDVVGCRWWTSTESTIPRTPELEFDGLDMVYTPALFSREVFFKDAFEPEFSNRLKVNGHFSPIPEERGGHIELIGWCHTFWPLLPPEEHFEAHPEWYSEIDGQRVAGYTQICLTNDEARAELTRNVLARLRENPGARLISVSQNDWGGRCQCAACVEVEREEDSPAGPLVRFVNAVAEDVEAEFPDVLVETLAYQYTRKAPSVTRPRHNVVIRLCSIEADFARPLRSEANADFAADVEAWSAIADNLYIWNYVVNFANFLFPHPNLRPLDDDVRFLVDHGAIGFFEQGDAYANGGDLNELRAWVLAHLLWDPSRDGAALIREFVEGYYGPAAPHIMQYLGIIHDAIEASGMALRCFTPSTDGWLTLEALSDATRTLDSALAAVGGDEALQARVRRMRLPLDHVWLARYQALRHEAGMAGAEFLGPDDPQTAYEAFAAALEEFGTGFYGEGRPLDGYLPTLEAQCRRRTAATPPAEVEGLDPDDWIDVQDGVFGLHGVGDWVMLVEDASASDGVAAQMPGHSNQWACQYAISSPALAGGAWRVYAVVRCEAAADDGAAFTLGLYDGPGAREVAQMTVTLAEAGDGQYHAYDLGSHELREGMYIWVAPPGDADLVSHVFVDRFFLVRE